MQYTVEELIVEHSPPWPSSLAYPEEEARGAVPDDPVYWQHCLAILQDLKSSIRRADRGILCFRLTMFWSSYHEVVRHVETEEAAEIPHWILSKNLYGVDLSPEAVEITQLALWIRSAAPGQTLATLSQNIVHGNSLVHDAAIHPAGFDLRERFAERSTAQAGFDCVVGNPPWERMKLQEREFFSLPAPEIATATNAAKRRQLVAKLEADDPDFTPYQPPQGSIAASCSAIAARASNTRSLARATSNLYAVFAELAYQIVSPQAASAC